ncbi:PTS-dependent dihydroxyacetone kinase, phosphotransferase subunit dhaM [Anaerococcus prevotii]|uniref:phosphoenolpyruvate--glycerone phosphotransferase n=1 Tax=Anaerococcus prevotii (strain ATCC 9321 / DSM 20548 / JCM 6508 / NCTC 11806 / PC1) TaxID=525919 RepID=C7RHZ8_ANAPD|nr:dihydroxyacetone kinase phosphoryl donor subunit DhaM [Anaerococcus prevotii]ACV29109.1 PTS system fructose subfamily IIA component [Anaerococcus prevotii DSM 20548]SUU94783.1 PTS-dependent dihydroxyacetone kinase, phosphotransferase subunit dhaM [Anaerococcus prevotii]
MINILIASHSKDLAKGLSDIIGQMTTDVRIEYSGGDDEGNLGSNFEEIFAKMNELAPEGLVVFFDMGSSMMNVETAYSMLDEDLKEKVLIAGSPLVESALEISLSINEETSLDDIKEKISSYKFNKLD